MSGRMSGHSWMIDKGFLRGHSLMTAKMRGTLKPAKSWVFCVTSHCEVMGTIEKRS